MSASLVGLTPEALLLLPRPAEARHYKRSDGEIIVGKRGRLCDVVSDFAFAERPHLWILESYVMRK